MRSFRLPDLVPGTEEFPAPTLKTDPFGGTYLGDGVVITRLWTRHLMKTSAGDTNVTPFLLGHGFNEPQNTRILLSLIRPGSVFVDAGANIGYFSVLGAWRAWPDGQIWSFEPHPRLFPLLSDNLTMNGFAGIAHRHRLALSDRAGTATLRVFEGYEATSTIRPVSEAFLSHTARETGRPSHTIEVETACLDQVMRAVPAIDVMKLDIEGHEPAMMRGAREIIARSPNLRIVSEFVPGIMDPAEALGHLALLREWGFSVFRIGEDAALTPCPDDRALLGMGFSDLLFLRH